MVLHGNYRLTMKQFLMAQLMNIKKLFRDLTDPRSRVPDVAVVNGTHHIVSTCVPVDVALNIYIYIYIYMTKCQKVRLCMVA